MYSEYRAYMDMFKPKHIIKEDDDELTLDDLNDIADQTAKEEQKSDKEKQPAQKTVQPKPEQKPTENSTKTTEADMKFSVDLATEFSNTINEFTTICAKIVETRVINKELSDKFYEIYGKIKNLADAASKTE